MARHHKRRLGKLARVGAALATGGASELAMLARNKEKKPLLGRLARVGAALATGGASEVARAVWKIGKNGVEFNGRDVSRAGHRGAGPNPHPAFRGPPRPLPGHLRPRRAMVARHLAGIHGPVLPDERHGRVIHPRPGRLKHRRSDVYRTRHGFPVDE